MKTMINMTATEQLKTTPKHLDRLEQFLNQDETGQLFNKAITEFVLGLVPMGADQSNHGTIFRSGNSAGATRVRYFIDSFDPIAVAEDIARKAAEQKLKTPTQLPSAIAEQKRRLGQ